MDKRTRTLRELAVVMTTLPAGSMIEPRYMQACEPNFIIRLIDCIEEDKDNATNMLRDIKDYKDMLEAKDEIISLHIEQVKKLEAAIYDLQMADTMLEFISRVGEVGLHHEWNAFCDKLARLEKK